MGPMDIKLVTSVSTIQRVFQPRVVTRKQCTSAVIRSNFNELGLKLMLCALFKYEQRYTREAKFMIKIL